MRKLERSRETGKPLIGQAGLRPHPPRPPHRPRRLAAQAARLPGAGPPGGLRRGLHHGDDRRPERPQRAAPGAELRGGAGERAHLRGAGLQDPRPGAHAGGVQLQLARRRSAWRTSCASRRSTRWPACWSARTSRDRFAERRADLAWWSSCTRSSRRTTPWRCRPTWSSAAPTRSSTSWSPAPSRSATARSRRSACCMPLLRGTDGVQKMSKSYDNYVGLADAPEEQYGRTMSIPDELLEEWYRLASGLERRARWSAALARARDASPTPPSASSPRRIVALYHGDEAAAREAAERFDLVHRQHGVPEDVPDVRASRRRPGARRGGRPGLAAAPAGAAGARALHQPGGAAHRAGRGLASTARRSPTATPRVPAARGAPPPAREAPLRPRPHRRLIPPRPGVLVPGRGG